MTRGLSGQTLQLRLSRAAAEIPAQNTDSIPRQWGAMEGFGASEAPGTPVASRSRAGVCAWQGEVDVLLRERPCLLTQWKVSSGCRVPVLQLPVVGGEGSQLCLLRSSGKSVERVQTSQPWCCPREKESQSCLGTNSPWGA